jgi:hypothetical protein
MGKPSTAVTELFVCFMADQLKSVPAQFIFWWVVIRRCGKFESGNFKEWEDEEIWMGGV